MRLPNRQTLLVVEPGVEVTAKEAPPSMTYKGPFPTVGMTPMVAYMTYLDENPIELSGSTKRITTKDVEISASTERTVESDAPILVEIGGSTERYVTNDVEITAQTIRNVTSFQVDLEFDTRRDVIVSGDLEVGTQRNVEAIIEIEASSVRVVLNDEDAEQGIPTKEYGSFVEKNKLFRVQHDVLNEDVSDNPYFEKQISNLRNAALLTRNQTVIKAINELFVSQREAFLSTFTALEKVNSTLGDLVTNKTLRAQYAKMGAESVIDGLVKLSNNVDTIINFIGMQADTIEYYEELGYKDLLDTLKGLNEKIKQIDFNWEDLTEDDLAWMFRATDYIPEIKDQVFSLLEQMQEEIDAFKNGTTTQFLNLRSETELTLARQYQTLIEKMNSPYERVTEKEIRDMFRAIGQEEDLPDEEEDVYFQMFQSLSVRLQAAEESFEAQINTLKQNQAIVLQDLEGWADVTLRDVREMFGDISEDEDAQDVYIELFRTFSERLDAQTALFEQEVARLETKIRQAELLEDWASITEKEIKRIFDLFDPDASPDEDPYASLLQQLSDRISENRELLDSYIETSSIELNAYASITEEEIRRIFEILSDSSTGEQDKTFEDYIVELIQSLTDRWISEEASLVEMQNTIRQMREENADISEDEIRRIFEILQNDSESESSFEERISEILSGWQDQMEEERAVVDELKALIRQHLEDGTDITEDEVRRIFETFSSEDEETFEQRLTEVINVLADRVEAAEATANQLRALTEQLEQENADITEDEVRRLFEMLQDGDSEEGYEARIISIINALTDRITAQEEESDRLRQRIANLEEQNDAFTRSLDLLSRSITTKFNNFTEDVNNRVRSILSSLENAEHAIEGTVTYEALVAYLNSELDATKSSVQELDNRVTGLEEKVEEAFTEDDIVSEDSIWSMFDPTAWIDNYEIASEDDIYAMFNKPVDEEGNPQSTISERVEEILDILATEEDIMELFRPFIGDNVEINSMEDLMRALANRNRE